jgi:hypothetical protein
MFSNEPESSETGEPKEEKIVRAIRTTRELWDAYGEAVEAQGTDRAKRINAHMKRTVNSYRARTGRSPYPDG